MPRFLFLFADLQELLHHQQEPSIYSTFCNVDSLDY